MIKLKELIKEAVSSSDKSSLLRVHHMIDNIMPNLNECIYEIESSWSLENLPGAMHEVKIGLEKANKELKIVNQIMNKMWRENK